MKLRILIGIIILFNYFQAYSADIFVDLTAPAGGNGTSWAAAFNTIDEALSIAAANDVINIAEGIYSPNTTLTITIPLRINGGFPAGGGLQNTTLFITEIRGDLDPTNLLEPIFDIGLNADTIFNGCTFTNSIRVIETSSALEINTCEFSNIGRATNDRSLIIEVNQGIQHLRFESSNFLNNIGAILREFNPVANNGSIRETYISDCLFEDNVNVGNGRLIAINSTENQLFNIINTVFRRNSTNNFMIEIGVDSDNVITTIQNCQFEENDNSSGSNGGIMQNRGQGSMLFMDNNIFSNNIGSSVGVMRLLDINGSITNSSFFGNTANASIAFGVAEISSCELRIEDCVFRENMVDASIGTAVLDIRDSDVIIERSSFIENSAIGSIVDGALEAVGGTNLMIRDCIFDGNDGGRSEVLTGFTFQSITIENSSFMNHDIGDLVNIFNADTASVSILGSTFSNNLGTTIDARSLLSMNIDNSSFTDFVFFDFRTIDTNMITNSRFLGNDNASRFMSFNGILNNDIENTLIISTAVMANHRIIDNRNGMLNLLNTTISSTDFANTNVSVRNGTERMTIENSIIWSGKNNLSQPAILLGSSSNFQISHSLIKGVNPTGPGNLDGTLLTNAPLFVSPRANKFIEKPCSPTVNAGNNALSTSLGDVDAEARVFEATIDIGAHELQEAKTTTACTIVNIIPDCTAISSPVNNEIDVALNADITWNPAANATGYLLSLGTTPGGSDILSCFDIRATNTYDHPTDFPSNTTIYVTVVPYNLLCEAENCIEEQFTTINEGPPQCTTLSDPLANAIDVAIDTDLSWNLEPSADDYLVTVETVMGTADILNNLPVTGTTLDLPSDLPFGTQIFVKITPRNSNGSALDCIFESFTTVSMPIFADVLPNVTECTQYTLPVLSQNNTYYTATNEGGTALNAGHIINSTQTIYIFAELAGQTNESSFTVTITGVPMADSLPDVNACTAYILPALTAGNSYFTETGGGGTQLNAGNSIPNSQTIYIYNGTANCFGETSFEVTITGFPIADNLSDIVRCSNYILPPLNTGNNYYTEPGANGLQLNSGETITASQLIYIYSGTTGCSSESSFEVTITSNIQADSSADVLVCDSYILPELSEFNTYRTEPNGEGLSLNPGEVITTTMTIYIFAEQGSCNDENRFTVSIPSITPVDILEDTVQCNSYVLPELTNGDYFTEPNGQGIPLFAGDFVDSEQTVYIYTSIGECSDESSFTITFDDSLCPELEDEEPTEEECILEFPKFMTPNGDGINDRFELVNNSCSFTGELRIFDRYAKLVFQTNDLSRSWDGTINGTPLPASDYWYQYIDGETNEFITGHFAVKR